MPGFFPWQNKTTCCAAPPETAAAQLWDPAPKMTGTCGGCSAALPVLSADENHQQLPEIHFPLKKTCFPPHIALNQSCTEARWENLPLAEAGACRVWGAAPPPALSVPNLRLCCSHNRSQQIWGKCQQETPPPQEALYPHQQLSGAPSSADCF